MTSAIDRDTPTSVGANGAASGQDLQTAASGLMQQAARTADAQASTTMTTAGDALRTVANHIRQAGEELRSEQPQVAGFIDTAAERVEGAATYLRERDASDAFDNLQSLARRQPALVIGAGVAAGLVIGRLLRGGAETAASGSSAMGYDRQGGTGYGSTSGYGAERYGAQAYGGSGYGATGYVAGTSSIGQELDDQSLSDSATGDGVRDEAPTARS